MVDVDKTAAEDQRGEGRRSGADRRRSPRPGQERRRHDRRQPLAPRPEHGWWHLTCPLCGFRHFWGYRPGKDIGQRAYRRYEAHYRYWHLRRREG